MRDEVIGEEGGKEGRREGFIVIHIQVKVLRSVQCVFLGVYS